MLLFSNQITLWLYPLQLKPLSSSNSALSRSQYAASKLLLLPFICQVLVGICQQRNVNSGHDY